MATDTSYPLTPSEVRLYIHDYAPNNYLIDGEEFSDPSIELAMKMAVGDYNLVPPLSRVQPSAFPSVTLLMLGTLAHLFIGKAAHLARNSLSYTDGGLQIPIEERAELYLSMGNAYMGQFKDGASKLKAFENMEAGWGSVRSDSYTLPYW